jgi:hypothetical protein
MGNSGNSTGAHLHFGVYRDDGNGEWDGKDKDKPVDPFGWQVTDSGAPVADPWVTEEEGPVSYHLWKYDLAVRVAVLARDGAVIEDLTNHITATIPPGAFMGQLDLELAPGSVADPAGPLRSAAQPFWARVLRWLPGEDVSGDPGTRDASGFAFGKPITLTVSYSQDRTLHLDVSRASLFRWSETLATWRPLSSTVHTADRTVSATTEQVGAISIQAPLLCPADQSELDDTYYLAKQLPKDATTARRLFDVAQDEDWFLLEILQGATYTLQTANLSEGVDTVVGLYDADGVALLVSNDDGGDGKASRVQWVSPRSGTYFVRVTQGTESAFGCDAAYELTVRQDTNLYLPIIVRLDQVH